MTIHILPLPTTTYHTFLLFVPSSCPCESSSLSVLKRNQNRQVWKEELKKRDEVRRPTRTLDARLLLSLSSHSCNQSVALLFILPLSHICACSFISPLFPYDSPSPLASIPRSPLLRSVPVFITLWLSILQQQPHKQPIYMPTCNDCARANKKSLQAPCMLQNAIKTICVIFCSRGNN